MAFNPCSPCGCIPANIDPMLFHQMATSLLCQILAVLDEEGGEDVNIASWGGTPTTLGQKAMAASVPVVIASDQTSFPVTIAAGAATIGSIASITTSVVPGTGATNLGKAEDAAAVSGDTGVAILGKRTDTAAVQTDTTNDYNIPVTNSFGAFQINIDQAFQSSNVTGLLHLEDAASAAGDAGVSIVTVREDSPANNTSAVNDWAAMKSAEDGAVWTALSSNRKGTGALFQLISAATTNATSVKGGVGVVYSYNCINNGVTIAYVKLYNKASSPTVGTDVAVKIIGVPAAGNAELSCAQGWYFSTGIALAITGGMATADTTAVGAAAVSVDLQYG